MKQISFLTVGIIFGIILTKSEVVSWWRIQEMFRFQAFHMYGVIGTAVIGGAIALALSKRLGWKAITGQPLSYSVSSGKAIRFLLGGGLFGLGWAMTGACPGPTYVLVGNGYGVFLLVIASALLGTLTYGAVRERLPH